MDNEWESMLDELFDAESGLSGWEIDFLESLDGRRGNELTEKQSDKLEQIYKRLKG